MPSKNNKVPSSRRLAWYRRSGSQWTVVGATLSQAAVSVRVTKGASGDLFRGHCRSGFDSCVSHFHSKKIWEQIAFDALLASEAAQNVPTLAHKRIDPPRLILRFPGTGAMHQRILATAHFSGLAFRSA